MNDLIFLKETFLTRVQATAYIQSKGLNIGKHFLTYMATQRRGPPYKLFGSATIYSITDIDAWLESPEVRKTEKRGRPWGPATPPHNPLLLKQTA
jgi:hypothetical protein